MSSSVLHFNSCSGSCVESILKGQRLLQGAQLADYCSNRGTDQGSEKWSDCVADVNERYVDGFGNTV